MRLIIDLGSRQVYWDMPDENGVILLQSLVQSLGPADGDVEQ